MVISSLVHLLTMWVPYYEKLWLSTLSGTLSLNYNYSQPYFPAVINLQQTINYNKFLICLLEFPNHFVFNTGAIDQINKYTGTFIRIA